MSIDCIGSSRSTEPGTTVRVDPERLTWGPADTFQAFTDVDLRTARYWSTRVFRPAHSIGHPVPQPDCPGCRYETAVAR